jgi:pyrophosphatase PpaX
VTAPPRWPTVLFDLDGTLVDTIDLITSSYDYALGAVLGTSRPPEQVRSWIGRTLRSALAEDYPEHVDELEAAYLRWNRANTARLLRPYAGVETMVRDLLDAQVRIGVATSKRQESAATALRLVGLTDLIDVVAAPLLHAAARLSSPPEHCVYVGDAAVDVRAAQAAGMSAIAVTWGAGVRDELAAVQPEAIVDSVADLTVLLLGSAQGKIARCTKSAMRT